MRVIAGEFRGRVLKAAPGLDVRPTADRLRETLFDILGRGVYAATFLDICAGSGAVGIEALSRGASSVTFIDRSKKSAAIIQQNVDALGAGSRALVILRDAVPALNQFEQGESFFDVIFFDPPYASELYKPVLLEIGRGKLLAEDGIIVVEHHSKRPLEPEYGKLRQYRTVRQGESALTFYAVV